MHHKFVHPSIAVQILIAGAAFHMLRPQQHAYTTPHNERLREVPNYAYQRTLLRPVQPNYSVDVGQVAGTYTPRKCDW